MEKDLDKYIRDHSSPEDKVLEELYRQTHLYVVNPNMASGHIQGKFLEMLSYMIHPECILEIGTYTGYSAICLARGLKTGGQLHTIEVNDELNEMSTHYFALAGVADRVTLHTGRAPLTLCLLMEINVNIANIIILSLRRCVKEDSLLLTMCSGVARLKVRKRLKILRQRVSLCSMRWSGKITVWKKLFCLCVTD